MLYFKCPTCRTILANKQLLFTERLEKICKETISEENKDTKKQQLLDELEVKRICCRMRILTFIKLVEIVH